MQTPFDAKTFLAALPARPGVYIFYDRNGNALYVGKANNLKKRAANYFRKNVAPKTQLMTAQIARAETQQTRTENEALLLENHLIKDKHPRYNILLRDDKSFPYIRLSEAAEFPRFSLYRGRRTRADKFYGPYPNVTAAREMLGHLHKIFRLRQCTDAFFRNRSRPCLQYQIKRCSAPCVGRITRARYREDVRQAKAMLAGRDNSLLEELGAEMERASKELDYEHAALMRDRIALLRRVHEKQYIAGVGDADAVALALDSGLACFCVMTIRQGRNLGSRFDVQANPLDLSPGELLAAFLPQHYLGRSMPGEIILGEAIPGRATLQQTFCLDARAKVAIKIQVRAHRRRWIESARVNAADHLRQYLSARGRVADMFNDLTKLLGLAEPPKRVECFDISHTLGERAVAACVVFEHEGEVKSDYRRFNISGVNAGDDYAAMRQALTRRYKSVMQNDGKLPDIVMVDGGKGQLRAAREALEEMQIADAVVLLGVSKGAARRPGDEKLHLVKRRPFAPGKSSPALHLIQRIRDEAHRFAITGHRQRRAKARSVSPLEQIPGVGEKRRRNLLRHFGGLREIARAGVEDLANAPGISREIAEKIFNRLH